MSLMFCPKYFSVSLFTLLSSSAFSFSFSFPILSSIALFSLLFPLTILPIILFLLSSSFLLLILVSASDFISSSFSTSSIFSFSSITSTSYFFFIISIKSFLAWIWLLSLSFSVSSFIPKTLLYRMIRFSLSSEILINVDWHAEFSILGNKIDLNWSTFGKISQPSEGLLFFNHDEKPDWWQLFRWELFLLLAISLFLILQSSDK